MHVACNDRIERYGPTSEKMIDIYCELAAVDGVTYPQGSLGMRLASGWGKTKVFKNTHLPDSLDTADFDGMNYRYVQMDGSSDGTLLQFVVDSVEAIETP